MKKVLLLVSILFLSNCFGYKPIISSKDINFHIGQINNVNNDNISKQIIKSLKPYTIENNKTEILIEIQSNKTETIISRDSKGDPLLHEIRVQTEIKIVNENKKKTLKFNEFFNFNNQDNKFEFSQYKKNIQKNLANRIFEKLILELQKI